MKRADFLKLLSFAPFAASAMKLQQLHAMSEAFGPSEKMPVLFLGHGSPMNAIEENEFVSGFRNIGNALPTPKAVLCISAHWETKGTWVTAMEHPRTIHDFGGFPRKLFEVQYPAPGSPDLASNIKKTIRSTEVGLDDSWGLDHGTWSVVKHLYPEANIPVLQLSIDYTKDAAYHYALAKELDVLRSRGILIIGSGNMVHNLRMLDFSRINDDFGYEWALEARQKMNSFILNGDHQSLINYKKQGNAFSLSIPTPEHFIPLIYTLALQGKSEKAELFNDKALAGSITMTSVKIS